jgi:hypothetical protein
LSLPSAKKKAKAEKTSSSPKTKVPKTQAGQTPGALEVVIVPS